MNASYGLAVAHLPLASPPRSYSPLVYAVSVFPGVVAGNFHDTPAGVILHGSRSGAAGNPTSTEFVGTARYAVDEPNGYGWNATIGSDEIALHMSALHWGWNARGCSPLYLAVEFAQPTAAEPIDDGQVRAFCWFFAAARAAWPDLPRFFPTHAELDGTPQYGAVDGKTDVFPVNDPRVPELEARINARLDALGVR